jgi:hypothetical protein
VQLNLKNAQSANNLLRNAQDFKIISINASKILTGLKFKRKRKIKMFLMSIKDLNLNLILLLQRFQYYLYMIKENI